MIWRRQWNESSAFLDVLRAEILRRAASEPTYYSKNVGGWRSHDDFFRWPLAEVAELRGRFAHAVAGLPVEHRTRPFRCDRAWAIVNRAGSYHQRHTHGEAVWSGIYYVDAGGVPSARTLFETVDGTVYVTPVPGLMTIFPSSMFHSVEPHLGDGLRITIAFDAQ